MSDTPLTDAAKKEGCIEALCGNLEREHMVMRSLLLRIYYARVAMNHDKVIAALNDIDKYFFEPNHN